MGTPPALAIEDLSISFPGAKGETRAVQDVTLSVARGKTLALVGESGSGKTLTASSVLGLLPPSARRQGSIFVDGDAVQDLTENELVPLRGGRIAIIMQEPMAAMNPIMTVGRQVKEAVRLRDDHDTIDHELKVVELLEEVGLDNPEERRLAYPHELSGGQLQRIMIAMALARDPDILIADEPTTSLDVTIQRQILELLESLQRSRGMAMLFISHDLAVVARIAHEVAVMYRGGIVERGSVQNILRSPRHYYTRRLLASHPEGKQHKTLLPVSDETQHPARTEISSSAVRLDCGYDTALAVRDIELIYRRGIFSKRGVRALKGVTMHLERGETLGIVGESGSGKSSLAKAILGIEAIESGSVELFETDMATTTTRQAVELRRRCQIVFQNSAAALNPRLTLLQLLAEPFQLHGNAPESDVRTRAASLLWEVGLSPAMLARYPHELSGGQRQRVNIARALASDPEVLVCDEAVSSLDISVQAQVLNLLMTIQRERAISLLFISHDLLATCHISDRICVMKDGAIVEQGLALDIFDSPRTEYTRNLLESCPRLY
ncbi:MAG: dipeptide ABC transporter ATP-binding protein [Oceanidesulfovibrio sp.]